MTSRTARPDRAAKYIPTPRDCDGLGPGEWVNRRGVMVWTAHECADCGGYLKPGDRCDTCLTWAVKNARDTEWARITRARRSIVWDILTLRDEHRSAA